MASLPEAGVKCGAAGKGVCAERTPRRTAGSQQLPDQRLLDEGEMPAARRGLDRGGPRGALVSQDRTHEGHREHPGPCKGGRDRARRLTPAARVHVRVVLVVQVRLVQVPKRLELHLGVLEEAQLHQQRQPHEPQLRTRGGMAGHRGRRGRGSRSLLAGGAPGFGPAGAELTSPSRTPCPAAPRLTKLSDQSASA